MKHTTEFEKTPENGLIWQDRSSLKDYIFSLPEGKYYLMAVKVAERRTLEQNGSGIAEGRDLKDKSFNLARMPNRITND